MAEAATQYRDMAWYMMEVVERDVNLTQEERNLISTAYRSLLEEKRRMQDKEEVEEEKKGKVAEVREICQEAVSLADRIQSGSKNVESKAFFLKMKADYQRYQLETISPMSSARKELEAEANVSYESALSLSRSLPPTHPIRLGVALNYSLFFKEIVGFSGAAYDIARTAFDDGNSLLDTLADETYKESTLQMQLLRDNIILSMSSEEEKRLVE